MCTIYIDYTQTYGNYSTKKKPNYRQLKWSLSICHIVFLASLDHFLKKSFPLLSTTLVIVSEQQMPINASDDSGTDHKCREVFNFNLPNSLCTSRSQPVETNFNQSCWWKSELQSILSSMPNSSMSSTSTCHGSHEFAYSWPSSHILRAELHGLLDAVGTQSSSHTTWS